MKKAKDITRVVVPDTHGAHVDTAALAALLADVKRLDPDEIVLLGDHLDCGGVFSTHSKSYTNELTESFEDDVSATNEFLDALQALAPRATIDYLEGNHENRVSRFVASTFQRYNDAEGFMSRMGPEAVLHLRRRGVKYYKRSEMYQGISIPGTIRKTVNGKAIYYTHGISAARHATAVHLARFGNNVVHGHIHRAQSVHGRTVEKGVIGAWCPGTLAKLQPLYAHTNLTDWSHGYGLQMVSSSGRFVHFQVPICSGESMLGQVERIRKAG